MATPYQKFYEVLKTPATRKTYEIQMRKFFGYAHTDYDGLVKLPDDEIEELIFNYIVALKLKTEKTGMPNPNTYRSILAPIQTFLEQNDVLLNWKKLKRYCPARIPLSNQLAYRTDHIQNMFKIVNCPRDIAFVHLLASTGIRIGAVYDLTCGDVHYIKDGAVILIYKDTTSEHRVCLTPEATTALKDYLATRNNTKAHDPLFTIRNNSRKLTDGSIKDIMKRLRNKIGLNEGNGKKSKNSYSANHAFRKRVEIIFAKARVESSFKSYLTNHDMTVSVYHYFKSVDDESLYQEFKKAIPELTIDDIERLNQKHELEKQALTQNIPEEIKEKIESIEGQLVEIKNLKKKVHSLDELSLTFGKELWQEAKKKEMLKSVLGMKLNRLQKMNLEELLSEDWFKSESPVVVNFLKQISLEDDSNK